MSLNGHFLGLKSGTKDQQATLPPQAPKASARPLAGRLAAPGWWQRDSWLRATALIVSLCPDFS